MKRVAWVYLVVAVCVGGAFAFSGGTSFLLASVNLSALVVIVAGIRINRLPAWPCWGPIAAALFAWTIAVVWISRLPPMRDPGPLPDLLNALVVVPFAALAFGLVALLRRQREVIGAPLVDVAMFTIAGWLLITELGLGTHLAPDLVVLALSFRLLLGSTQPPAGWLLLGGITAGVITDVAFAVSLAGVADLPTGVAQSGWILARSAIAAAALHPSSVELMRRRPERVWPPLAAVAAVALPATVVPVTIAFHAHRTPGAANLDRALLVLAGSSVLIVLAFLRVGLMVSRHRSLKSERDEESARFRALVEQLPVATYLDTLDDPPRTLYISDQVVELTGFLPQELIEDPDLWANRVPEPYRSAARQAVRQQKSTGGPLSIEYPFETRRRKRIWVGHRARLVCGQNGRPLYIEGVLFDITDAKERERPLLQKMKVLTAVFESAAVGVVTVGRDGKVLSVNPALVSMLGYTEAELRTLDLQELAVGDGAAELVACFFKTLRGELDPHQTEVELRAKSGQTVVARVTMLSLSPDEQDDDGLLCVLLEDVTDAHRSREELKKTAVQLQGVISNLPVVLFTLDAQKRMQMLSGRGANAYGSDLTRLVGIKASEFLSDAPAALEAVEKAFSGEPQHLTAMFPRFGGWWEVWYSPLWDSSGAVNGMLGVATNVSERMAEQQALQQSLSLLNTTFDSIADGVVATDLEGRPVTYNKQFVSMWGVPAAVWETWDSERRRAHIFEQIKTPADARERAAEVEKDPGAERVTELELRNGRTFETRVTPQKMAGEVVGRVVTFHDVTQQRRSRSLLEDQAQILREVARDAPLASVLDNLCRTVSKYSDAVRCSVCLADGANRDLVPAAAPELTDFYAETGPIAIGPNNGSCGSAAYHAQRVFVEDVMVDPLWERLAEIASRHDIRSSWSEPIRSSAGEVLGTLAIYHAEPRYPDADEVHMVELCGSLAAVAIERDLARERRAELEDRLRQAEKMESAGRLARGFAHDLGNVLTAIGLNADLLRGDVRSERGHEALDDLDKATSMAGRLVNDLLNLMRPAYPELVDVNVLVQDMSSLLRTVVKETIALDIRAKADPPWTEIDVSQFQQVLLNLVMNSNEAIAHEGRITIEAASDLAAGSVQVGVIDDGIGMDRQTQEQAFEPFFTTKPGGGAKGVGLGLASANAAIARIGGRITIASEAGRGTEVRVHLPLAVSRDDAAPELILSGGGEQ